MPAIGKVSASGNTRILVTWSGGANRGATNEVDLAPLIFSRKIFAPLRNDPALFGTVHIIEGGQRLPGERAIRSTSPPQRLNAWPRKQ